MVRGTVTLLSSLAKKLLGLKLVYYDATPNGASKTGLDFTNGGKDDRHFLIRTRNYDVQKHELQKFAWARKWTESLAYSLSFYTVLGLQGCSSLPARQREGDRDPYAK